MTHPSLKIDQARYVITVDDRRRVIRDGSVVVRNGLISHIGKADELRHVGADRVIDATDMVVTPGFLNGHMHISYAHSVRGVFPDDVPDRLRHVFAMQSVMTEEEEHLTTLLGLAELLGTGTTTLVDPGTTKFPEACLDAYDQAGCRVIIGEQVQDRENGLNLPVYDTADALERVEASVKALDGRLSGRVRAWAMPFSLEFCSPELLIGAKRIADHYGTALTLHHSGGARAPGPEPTERLAQLGVLGPNLLLSHCMDLTDREIELIASSGAGVVVCPSTVMKAGGNTGRGGRLPELLDAGVAVSLGTDSVNSSNFSDMVRCVNIAATVYKDVREDNSLIPAETALELATRTGATALGFADSLGAVEVGRKGDLVLFDTRRPEWRALTDPVRNLVYSATGDSVDTVIVDGRVVFEAGRPCFVGDLWELIQKVEKIGKRVRAATGVGFPSRWPVI
ncbi:MAG: amidohydrolase family protein [Acidimicrobiia bacterium]|nr:amidohydrolase family protein [Acidimicrobiia bacterium]MYG92321.1 amidohydrolase family protein [Acidimicrobiia bacterium]